MQLLFFQEIFEIFYRLFSPFYPFIYYIL